MDLKVRLEQRQKRRRSPASGETLSVHEAFDALERAAFRAIERRRQVRRERDVKQAIARIEG